MSSATVGHRFNSDLKLDKDDRRWLDPDGVIRHVLIHKDLPQVFEQYDEQANYAKRQAQIYGLWAIGLIWFALILVAFELHRDSLTASSAWLVAIFALVGIIANVRVLVARRKQKWFQKWSYPRFGLLVILLICAAIATAKLKALGAIPLPAWVAAGMVAFSISAGVIWWFSGEHVTRADRELAAIRREDLVVRPGMQEWLHEFWLPGIFVFLVAALALITVWKADWIPYFGVVPGIGGVLFGLFGILIGPRKQRWLHNRLRTERIRQFYFQTFLLRVGQILKGDDELKACREISVEFDNTSEGKTAVWLRDEILKGDDEFKATCQKRLYDLTKRLKEEIGVEFNNTTEGKTEVWLWEDLKNQEQQAGADIRPGETEQPIGTAANEELKLLFPAYRELRIQHQIDYTSHKLREGHRRFFASPVWQANVLWGITLGCIISICLFHACLLFVHWPYWSVFIIIFAITALAVRAIEQGLQPEREKERYQQYLWALEDVRERFDMRKPEDGNWKVYQVRAALRIMEEMERLSYREMRDFLICNDEAMFVM
jgi:hypothetical protein